jgi:transcriptional regulator with XRE-family HTH domain
MKIDKRKLESERKRLGISMAAFSRKLGMTDSTYSKIIDSESTTLKTLTRIAEKLHINPLDLLTK